MVICFGQDMGTDEWLRMYRTNLAALPSTNVNQILLNIPDPVGKGTIEDKVRDDGQSSGFLCGFEAPFVVESKGSGGDDDGSVS